MKEVIVTYRNSDTIEKGSVLHTNPQITFRGNDIQVSDGYHTFDELYEHRDALFIALCRALLSDGTRPIDVWRSKLHNDGTSYEGYFIMGIGEEAGYQITYHLPLSKWKETEFAAELTHAPLWDGHTSADVSERLRVL